jgi:hypothetical protein
MVESLSAVARPRFFLLALHRTTTVQYRRGLTAFGPVGR